METHSPTHWGQGHGGKTRRGQAAFPIRGACCTYSGGLIVERETLRIDKWLWRARFCKTRALAQRRAGTGLIRLNGARVEKPSATVRPGDVLTIPRAHDIVLLRVLALGARRGPPAEARTLYELLQ
ncbi:MAG: RNA-binding S4 domain-containing protein [Alphaproteobacteria bacterium]